MATDVNVSVAMGSVMEEAKANVAAMPDAPPQGKSGMMKQGSKMIKSGMKSAGISFGLSSLLKQSQIFTGFLGSVFQIVGGMVDVLLAPLMPLFIPILQLLAKSIPIISKVANFIIGGLVTYILWYVKLFTSFYSKIFEFTKPVWEAIVGVWDSFGEAWGFIKEGKWSEAGMTVLNALWELVKTYYTALWNTFTLPFTAVHDFLTKFEWYNKLVDWITDFFKPLTDSVGDLWDSFSEAWGFIKEGKWGEALSTVWDKTWELIKTWGKTQFDALVLPFTTLHEWLTKFEWYNKLIDGMKNFFAPVIDLGHEMKNWAISFYNDKVIGWLQPLIDGLYGLINSAKLFGDDIAAPVLQRMTQDAGPKPSEITVTVGNTTGQALEMDITGADKAVGAVVDYITQNAL